MWLTKDSLRKETRRSLILGMTVLSPMIVAGGLSILFLTLANGTTPSDRYIEEGGRVLRFEGDWEFKNTVAIIISLVATFLGIALFRRCYSEYRSRRILPPPDTTPVST